MKKRSKKIQGKLSKKKRNGRKSQFEETKLSEVTYGESTNELQLDSDEYCLEPEEDESSEIESPRSNKSQEVNTCSQSSVEVKVLSDIWERIHNGQIDLSYASVGTSWGTWRPVYDYDLLLELLTHYGYTFKFASLFIKDMHDKLDDRSPNPIILIDSKKAKIYTSVKSIPEILKLMKEIGK